MDPLHSTMFMEPVLKVFGAPMGFCTKAMNHCLKSDGDIAQELAPRIIDLILVACTAVALVISIVCLVFEALGKLISKGVGLCNSDVREWHDDNINLGKAARYTIGILGLLLSASTVGWIMPSSHTQASQAVGEWVDHEDDGLDG